MTITVEALREVSRKLLANRAPLVDGAYFMPVSRQAAKAMYEANGGNVSPAAKRRGARGRKSALAGRWTFPSCSWGLETLGDGAIGSVESFRVVVSEFLP